MYLLYTEYTKGGKNMFYGIYLEDYLIHNNYDIKNESTLTHYTKREIANFKGGKVKIAETELDILDFINKTKRNSNNEKLYFGKIDNKLALKIYSSIELYLKDYNFSLQTHSLKHIFNNHGAKTKENKKGQEEILKDDILLLPTIISNYDKIYLSHIVECNNISFVIEKQIKNINYRLVCYVSNKKHNIEVKTLYKIKRTLPLCI